jgi:hypothetical protein
MRLSSSDNQITKHLIVKLLNTMEYEDSYEGGTEFWTQYWIQVRGELQYLIIYFSHLFCRQLFQGLIKRKLCLQSIDDDLPPFQKADFNTSPPKVTESLPK